MKEIGYEIPSSTGLPAHVYSVSDEEVANSIFEVVDFEFNYSESVTIEEFESEVEAQADDTINVQINNVNHQSVEFVNTVRDYAKLKNDEIKINIGRWSEEYISNYLQSQEQYTLIKWLNKEEEAYLPYDFIVVENQKEKYIEVKGTPSKDKGEFYMSKSEWNFMFKKKADYTIYRLFNAGKKMDWK